MFFRTPIGDFHCGIRAFRRERILALGLASTGMEFASEMVVKATLAGLRVSEVPTTLSVTSGDRVPHLRPWRDGWRHLRLLLLYSPRWLFLYPGAALAVVGFAATAVLAAGPVTVGGVRFGVATLLYAGAAVILGFQSVMFAVFARVFGITQGFLPDDPMLRRLFDRIRLETGLAVGAALVVAGLGGSAWAVATWADTSFGRLDYEHTLRIVVPSVVLLVLGAQTIVSSFFLSFLGLSDRNAPR
jgi:hypothetical protein